MYAKYAYNTNTTQANLLADVVAILTGTTDKTTLSAACDQANTSILTTYDVAGWIVHDAAAGTNKQCLKAPCFQDAAQYKYVVIDVGTAGFIKTTLYESWNATTHVGTNVAYLSDQTTYAQKYSATLVGSLYISASVRRIISWGTYSGLAFYGANGMFEFDTGFTWCAAGQGFIPAVWVTNGWTAYHPRYIGKNGTIITSSSGSPNYRNQIYHGAGTENITNTDAGAGNGAPMAGGMYNTPIYNPVFDLGYTAAGLMASGMTVSGMLSTPGVGAHLDELTYNGILYAAWSLTNNGKLLLPKG